MLRNARKVIVVWLIEGGRLAYKAGLLSFRALLAKTDEPGLPWPRSPLNGQDCPGIHPCYLYAQCGNRNRCLGHFLYAIGEIRNTFESLVF